MDLILWLSLSDRLTSARRIQGEAKQGKEQNEREKPVLHELIRTRAALSLPAAGHSDRAGESQQGACGHHVPK